jgi:hypothetical protein
VASVPRAYKRAQSEDGAQRSIQQYSRVADSSELAAAEMERKELGDTKKTSCVI